MRTDLIEQANLQEYVSKYYCLIINCHVVYSQSDTVALKLSLLLEYKINYIGLMEGLNGFHFGNDN